MKSGARPKGWPKKVLPPGAGEVFSCSAAPFVRLDAMVIPRGSRDARWSGCAPRVGVGRHRSLHRPPPRPRGSAPREEPAGRPYTGIHAPAHLRAADPADRSITVRQDWRGQPCAQEGPSVRHTFRRSPMVLKTSRHHTSDPSGVRKALRDGSQAIPEPITPIRR